MQNSVSRNWLQNLSTQFVQALIAFVSVPFLVHRLGNDTFGALTILWMFLGYFSFVDLGIGQGTIKYISEYLAKDERKNAATLFIAAGEVSLMLGMLFFLLMMGMIFFNVEKLFHMPSSLYPEVHRSMFILAITFPAVILQSSFKGIIIANNRFDIYNANLALNAILQWGGAVVVTAMGGSIFLIMILTFFTKYITLFILLFYSIKLMPEISTKFLNRTEYRKILLKFGGWVSISQIIAPLLSVLERMCIGMLLPLGFVTYYSIPNDTIVRFLVIPASLVSSSYPILSQYSVSIASKERAIQLYHKSISYIVYIMLLITPVLFIFGNKLLNIWLGPDLAEHCTLLFKIGAIGLFFISLAQLPNSFLQAIGKPEISAKISLFLFPFYLSSLYFFTKEYSIYGTAFVWLARVIVEVILLFSLSSNYGSTVSQTFNYSNIRKAFALIAFVAGFTALGLSFYDNIYFALLLFVSLCLSYILSMWIFVIDQEDKIMLLNLIRLKNV
jgi:O-antigen/teichoic acid export membrane protein